MRGFVMIMAAALMGVGGAAPVGGIEPTHCSFEFEVVLSPGLSMEPTAGTHRSDDPGTLECDGPVNGSSPTGVGIIEEEGRYGTGDPDTCMGGEGDGVDTLTVPTAAGAETVISDFTFTFGDKLPEHGGVAAGAFTGTRFTGTFDFTPIEGDCVTAPVTRANVVGEGIIHD